MGGMKGSQLIPGLLVVACYYLNFAEVTPALHSPCHARAAPWLWTRALFATVRAAILAPKESSSPPETAAISETLVCKLPPWKAC